MPRLFPRAPAAQPGGGFGVARATENQYLALRYWAGNTADVRDDNRDWPTRCGVAPDHTQPVADRLVERQWMINHRSGYIVTDLGRVAARLQLVRRDIACPAPDCRAVPGERCLDARGDHMVYVARVHIIRFNLAVAAYAAARSQAQITSRTGLPDPYSTDEPDPEIYTDLETVAPAFAARFLDPLEPSHVGIIMST
jgi:hypothetical protein